MTEARTARLDAHLIADAVRDRTGVRLVIEGRCPGDRRFDLVTLRFGLRPGNSKAAAWAHMSLRMADWAIRHFDPADVPYWLDLAETRLPA